MAHLGFISSWTGQGLSFPDVELGHGSWEPGPEPELLLFVDAGHLSHVPGGLQEKRSQPEVGRIGEKIRGKGDEEVRAGGIRKEREERETIGGTAKGRSKGQKGKGKEKK